MQINKSKKLEEIEDFLLRGNNIIRRNEMAEINADCGRLADVLKNYNLWIYDIKDFFKKNNSNPTWQSIFFESNSVSSAKNIIRGMGIDFQDEFCQKILKGIYNETKIKLDYLRKLYSEIEKEKKGNNTKITNKNICSIICVTPEHNNNLYKIVINKDYENYFKVSKIKKCWNLLYRIAEGENINFKNSLKGIEDYFNTNKKCKIYTKTDLELTNILSRTGNRIIKQIEELEIISEKAFKQRQKST